MLFLVSFSAINALLIATMTKPEVLRGDYCSCKMPLCWLSPLQELMPRLSFPTSAQSAAQGGWSLALLV